MSLVFNILLHLTLVGSLVIFLVLLIRVTFDTDDTTEKWMRGLGLLIGALIALGAQVSGEGFATYIVDSLATARPIGIGSQILGALIPALLGLIVAVLMQRAIERDHDKAMRFLVLVGMLGIVAFIEIYAEATSTQGVFLGAAALPNVGFMVGLGLTLLARYDGPGRTRPTNSIVDRLKHAKPAD